LFLACQGWDFGLIAASLGPEVLLEEAPLWCDAWQVLHKPQLRHCLLQCGAGNEVQQGDPQCSDLYWGTPRVIHLNQRCMGTLHKAIYPYPMQQKITNSDGIKQQQQNTLAHSRMQLAEQHYTNVSATHYPTINLFRIGLPQESHGNPPTPPPKALQQEIQVCPPQVHQGGRGQQAQQLPQ
jgi:hypothetical protein